MSQITTTLKNLGLTETEIKIYLTGLNYNSIGVSELVKQTKINRTTVYHAVGTLMQKGLLSQKGTGSRLVFMMSKPESIENLLSEKIKLLEKQKREINEIIPLLKQHAETSETKMVVSHYEGAEGIKLVIEDALYCKSKHWDIISPIKNYFSEFDKNYAKYFLESRRSHGLTSRSLWEQKESQKLLTPAQIKERNPRILPPIMHGRFKTVICIYDDKVLYISSVKELSAVLIQSQELHDTMQAIFDGLWENSSEI